VAAALPGVSPSGSARLAEILSKGTYSMTAAERAEEVKIAMRQVHTNYLRLQLPYLLET
jgi:hypothetical protein